MSASILIKYHKTPFGELMLGSYENQICICDWRYRKMRPQIDKRILSQLQAEYKEGSNEVMEKAIIQVEEYFSGTRTQFDLPLLLIGSEFQKTVWEALIAIPFGETNTYLGLSKDLNNEKAIRAVATANGANAISIIVPCHRIIGSDGKLVGYAGGLATKKKLLELEGSWNPNQLSLF